MKYQEEREALIQKIASLKAERDQILQRMEEIQKELLYLERRR